MHVLKCQEVIRRLSCPQRAPTRRRALTCELRERLKSGTSPSIPPTSYHTSINPTFSSHTSPQPICAIENLVLLQSHLPTPQRFLPKPSTEAGAIRATTHQLYTLSSSCKFTSNTHLRMQQRNRQHEHPKTSSRFEDCRSWKQV
jgi:hypothetical protein